MFTGIIETLGIVRNLRSSDGNLNIDIESNITADLKIDQSVAHNGVCLTVVLIEGNVYTVTAIDETLKKSNLGDLSQGDRVNLERAMKLGDRLDGHIVQGHVDGIGTCKKVVEKEGSWIFTFGYEMDNGNTTIEKGSITVNGVSLTVLDSKRSEFSVAIIPYTYEHTNFKTIKKGVSVNLEFDVIGKYVKRISEGYF